MTPWRTRKHTEQIELAFRIYYISTKITPCIRYKNSDRRYITFPQENKNNNYYAEYICLRKPYDIRSRNRIFLASE
jgi:hypothetical protein